MKKAGTVEGLDLLEVTLYLSSVLIRKLIATDAPAFRDFRIEIYREHPEAFGSSVA